MKRILDFVVPILDPTPADASKINEYLAFFEACGHGETVHFVCPVSYSVGSSFPLFTSLVDADSLTVDIVQPNGIYSAYNHGISLSCAAFINFMGIDDQLLLDEALWVSLLTDIDNKRPKLVIAFVQTYSANHRAQSRICNDSRQLDPPHPMNHQGLFYSSLFFSTCRYSSSFSVAADYHHYLNHVLPLLGPKDVFFLGKVTHLFCLDGFSSRPSNIFYTAVDILKARLNSPFALRSGDIIFFFRRVVASFFYLIRG